MAFPEIDNSSDSVSGNAEDINQTKDAVSSMANLSPKQTEISQPETTDEEFSLPDDESWIVLELHNPENLYAYWNVVSEDREKLRNQGGQQFALRFYDVTFIDMDVQKPHSLQEYECEESAKELYIHVPMKERDYIVEIGYVTEAGRWLKLVRSSHINFPWDFPWPEEPPEDSDEADDVTEDELEETSETEETTATEDSNENDEPEETTAVEDSNKTTDVKPLQTQSDLDDIPTEEISVVEVPSTMETTQTSSRIETTPPIVKPTESVQKFIETETSQLEEPADIDSDSTENKTSENQFSDQEIQSNIAATKFNLGQSETAEELAVVDEGLPSLPGGYGETKIVLLPVDPDRIYVYWDIPNEERDKLRKQGGKHLGLRVYDVTEIDLDTQNPHSMEYHECDELAREWYITVPMSDRDYLVEIGYLTDKKRWLMLARSLHVRIPPVYPSDREDYQQRTVTWDENLRGKFFFNLKSLDSLLSFLQTAMQIFQNPFSNPIPS